VKGIFQLSGRKIRIEKCLAQRVFSPNTVKTSMFLPESNQTILHSLLRKKKRQHPKWILPFYDL
jgi:hypothetical protein